MNVMTRLLRRFGGRHLPGEIEQVDKDHGGVAGAAARRQMEARLRAIEIDLDIQGRRRVPRRG